MLTSSATSKNALRTFRLGLAFAAAFASLAIGGSAAAFHQDRAKSEVLSPDDFLRRYRDVLDRQKVRYHDARADAKMTGRAERPVRDPQSKDPTQTRLEATQGSVSLSVVVSGANVKAQLVHTGDIFSDGVSVITGDRSFKLRRYSPNGEYVLIKSESGGQIWPVPRMLRSRILAAPYLPAALPDFPEYVKDPEFDVTQVVRTTDSGGPCIKYLFRYRPSQQEKPSLEGWVRLQGESDWVVRDYDLEVTSRPVGKRKKAVVRRYGGSVLYTQNNEGVPVPSEIKYSERSSLGEFEEHQIQIERYTLGVTPPAEFTLAAFGLGDFEAPTARATNRGAYYLGIFGALALVLSFALATIARFRAGQRGLGSAGKEPASSNP